MRSSAESSYLSSVGNSVQVKLCLKMSDSVSPALRNFLLENGKHGRLDEHLT